MDLPEIKINVRTAYVEDRSSPDDNRYFFAYSIKIANNGDISAQLMSRHWVITDAENNQQEVRGDGVVGKQPLITPGTTFEYTSGTFLATPVGTMHGSYQMKSSNGDVFNTEIKPFLLSFPRTLH